MFTLSPRHWLAHWPRRLQLFVVMLAMLSVVAPTWHVCALSGHPISGHAGEEHQHGERDHFASVINADGSPGPAICSCAHARHEVQGQTIGPHPAAHNHVTCLALLLQTMPLHAGAAPILWRLPGTRRLSFAKFRAASAFAAPLNRRGRAPPANC